MIEERNDARKKDGKMKRKSERRKERERGNERDNARVSNVMSKEKEDYRLR